MDDSDIILFAFVIASIVGIVVTFFIFGVELPLYLGITIGGLSVYIFSDNPIIQLVGGWIGRFATILFFVSLFYYVGSGTFFPENTFEFKFLTVGISFLGDFSQRIGNFVLGFFN